MSQPLETPPVMTEPEDDRTSPALAVTGFLMIFATFLTANPSFGAKGNMWPWEMFARGTSDWLVKVVFLMWVAAGIWALAMAFTRQYYLRAVGVLIFAIILIVHCSGAHAGFTIQRFNLGEFAALIVLGAGLATAPTKGGWERGRVLAGIGAFFLVVQHAVGFEVMNVGPDQARLKIFFEDVQMWVQGDDLGVERGYSPRYAAKVIAPQLLMFGAAIVGFMAFVGFKRRTFLFWTFVVLIVAMVMPLAVDIFETATSPDPDVQAFARQLWSSSIEHGVLLFLLGCFGLSDLRRRVPTEVQA